MKVTQLFTFSVLLVILSSPAFAQPEPSHDSPLITNPNPALADINCLYVDVALHPSFYWPVDPNLLTVSQLAQKIEAVLKDAGINACGDVNSAMVAVLKKRLGSVSGLRFHSPDVPELRFDTDLLPLADSNQFVFRIQVSLSKKLSLGRNSAYHVMADVWKHEPVMRLVSSAELPSSLTAVALEQTRAFIAARSVAKQSDVNQISPRFAESNVEFNTRPVKQQNIESNYVASKNSQVFHKPDCQSAQKILPENLVTYKTRDEAVAAGKRPCKRCNP
jgi:hypothetical protein